MADNSIIIAEENWQEKYKILVILAHPDDPEFFCGATIARWCKMGHDGSYLLLTHGDKGGDEKSGCQNPTVKTGRGGWLRPIKFIYTP
ncbi:MAG: PIG-L family deacetylase [Anaerolineae bacterium]|nr:PIG-L family deacetylase [Anaerolineae bacterium]